MTEAIGLTFDLESEEGRRELKKLRDALEGVNQEMAGGKRAGKEYEAGMKGAADATKKQEAAAVGAAGGTSALAGASMALNPVIVGLTAAVAGLTFGLGALAVGVNKAMTAWDEQASVNNEVTLSLRNLGLSAAEAKAQLGELSALAGEFSTQTLYGDEAILQAVASLNQWSTVAKSASEIQEDLNLALGVAQTLQIDTANAAKEYARAAGGNVGAAEKLLGLTEEQKKSLTELKDVSERAAIIQDLLREKFEGAAQAVDPYQLAVSRLTDAQGDLWQAFGQGIATSGAFEPVLDALTGVLREVEGWTLNNQDAVRALVFDGVNYAIDSFDSLLSVIQFVSPALVGLATYLDLSRNWFGLVFDAVGLLGRGLYTLGATYVSFVTGRLESMLGKFADLADFVDSDFSRKLRSASAAMGDFSDQAKNVAADSFDKLKKDTIDAGDNIDGMIDALANAPARLQALNSGIEAMRARVSDLKQAMADAEAAGPSEVEQRATGGAPVSARDDLKQAEANLANLEAERAALELRNEVASRKLAILQEEDELKRFQLEYELQLFEMDQQKLTTEEIVYQSMVARNELQEKILGAEERRAAEAKRVADEQRKAQELALKNHERLKKEAERAARAQFTMWKGIGDLAAEAFEGAIDSAGALSLIRAIMYGAEAIGQLVFQNYTGAIAAGKAAVQYGAAAIMAGKGGGGGGGGGGGVTPSTGGGGGGGSQAREVGQVIAEEINRQNSQVSGITIVNDFRGATVLEESPTVERRLVDAMRRGLRVDGLSLGGV